MTEIALWTFAILLALVVVALVVLFRTPKATAGKGRLTRDLAVYRLVDRLRPGDHVLVTDKPGRPVGRGKHTVFLRVTGRGIQCQTTPLSRPFHRDPGDLVRLLGCGP